MKCPVCGHDNREGARFCKACGHRLEGATEVPEAPQPQDVCPSCGAATRPDARFCRRCGADLSSEWDAAPPAPWPAERAPDQMPTEPSPSAAAQPETPYAEPAWAEPSSTAIGQPQPQRAPTGIAGHRGALPRWLFWVGGGIVLLAVVALAAVALGGLDLLQGEEEVVPTAPPTAIPATAAPTEIPPTSTPVPASGQTTGPRAQVALAAQATTVSMGAPLTVTITMTNTGSVALSNLRYQLVGDWQPYLELAMEPIVRHQMELPPQASDAAVFRLQALQEGTAVLQGYVMADVPADPENRRGFLSAQTAVITVAPP